MTLFRMLAGHLVEKAHAACPPFLAQYAEDCDISTADFIINTAVSITNMFVGLIATLCVIGVIYGGLRIMSSTVDEAGKEEGKKIMITSLIGLVLGLAGAGLVNAVAMFVSFP